MSILHLRREHSVFLGFFIGLPWLNPFAPGPSAAMAPWLVSLACVGASALLLSLTHQRHTTHKNSPKFWIFIAAVALYFSLHLFRTGIGVEALATWVAWACVGVMAWMGVNLNHSLQPEPPSGLRALATMWLAVALVSCVFAVLQYLLLADWFTPWISPSTDGAAFANLRQRNQFATLCGTGLLALLYLQQNAAHPQNHMAWPWLAVTALAIGNGLSSSRTGALQWLVIAALVLCWRASLHRKVVQLGLGALAIYALVVALMPWFASVVGNASSGLWGRASENVGSSSRLWLYSNVLELIAQKPWLGWGWRELAYAHYSTPFTQRFGELLDNAHNLPLHLAVELGVPFAVLFCGAVLWWIVRSAPWRETDPTRQLAWGVLMLIGVHSMVEYPLWYGPFLMTLGLCIGLLQPVKSPQRTSMYRTAMQETPTLAKTMPNRPVAQWNIAGAATKGIAACLLVFAGYAAYDYHRVSQIYLDVASRSSWYSGDPLGHAQRSVLFQRQARFAELVTTPVTPASAPRVLTLAIDLIHFSPEPRVIEALIESATMLHFDDVAMFHLARYKEVYPKDYAAWTALK
jgi:Virulence factor membrane-bound polymerase, C-terminal/O-Antigen ligase/Protein glycosylation ligase